MTAVRVRDVVRTGVVLTAAAVVLWLERRHRARASVEPPAVHGTRNLVMAGIAAVTVHLVEAPVVVPLARLATRRGWGLTARMTGRRSALARTLVTIVLLDYTLYLWHIIVHRVPWLWRFHLVHHVDLDLDATTGLRFHAGELAASVPWRAAQVVVIGATPGALALWQSLTVAAVLFHHSNTRLSDRTERWLSWVLATPRMHAIHHSVDPVQLQSNFSSGLGLWDRLHGTLRVDAAASDVIIGMPDHQDPQDVTLGRVLALPFRPAPLSAGSHAGGA